MAGSVGCGGSFLRKASLIMKSSQVQYCGILELAETLKVIFSSLLHNRLDRGQFEATPFNFHGSNCRKFVESNIESNSVFHKLVPIGLLPPFLISQNTAELLGLFYLTAVYISSLSAFKDVTYECVFQGNTEN